MQVSLDPWGQSRQIDLVEDFNSGNQCGPDLLEHLFHGVLPRDALWIGSIHDMDEQVSVGSLLEGGLKGHDERVGQLPNEPNRIREHHESFRLEKDAATCGVEGGKELVDCQHTGMGQRIKDCGFACVCIAHQRDIEASRTGPGPPPVGTLLFKHGEPRLQLTNPIANQSAIGLELGLAWPTHANAAALPLQVRPALDQSSRQVVELCEFNLKLSLMASGPQGKDV